MKSREHVRVNITNDGLVVLDLDKGQIFNANNVAARIWQRLVIENKSQREVVDEISKEWSISPELVAQDVEGFVASLKQQEFVAD